MRVVRTVQTCVDGGVMCAGSDNKIFIWNVGTSEALIEIDSLPDIPLCASWNCDGSRFVVSCKDKKVRILDPRTGDILQVTRSSSGLMTRAPATSCR